MNIRHISSCAFACLYIALTNGVCFAEEAAHGGSSAPFNPIAIKGDLAIWTAVVFVIALTILWLFAWGPITKGLDKREANINDQIAQAKQQNEDAQKLLEQYRTQLTDAKAEVAQLLDSARKDAEQTKTVIVAKAKSDAEAEVQKAKNEIALAKREAVGALAGKAADLAVDLAGMICQKQLDKSAHSQIINAAVENFSKQAI